MNRETSDAPDGQENEKLDFQGQIGGNVGERREENQRPRRNQFGRHDRITTTHSKNRLEPAVC